MDIDATAASSEIEPSDELRPIYDGRGRLLGYAVWDGKLLNKKNANGATATQVRTITGAHREERTPRYDFPEDDGEEITYCTCPHTDERSCDPVHNGKEVPARLIAYAGWSPSIKNDEPERSPLPYFSGTAKHRVEAKARRTRASLVKLAKAYRTARCTPPIEIPEEEYRLHHCDTLLAVKQAALLDRDLLFAIPPALVKLKLRWHFRDEPQAGHTAPDGKALPLVERKTTPDDEFRNFAWLMRNEDYRAGGDTDKSLWEAETDCSAWAFMELLVTLKLPVSDEWLKALEKALHVKTKNSLKVEVVRQYEKLFPGNGEECLFQLRPQQKHPDRWTIETNRDSAAFRSVHTSESTGSYRRRSRGWGAYEEESEPDLWRNDDDDAEYAGYETRLEDGEPEDPKKPVEEMFVSDWLHRWREDQKQIQLCEAQLKALGLIRDARPVEKQIYRDSVTGCWRVPGQLEDYARRGPRPDALKYYTAAELREFGATIESLLDFGLLRSVWCYDPKPQALALTVSDQHARPKVSETRVEKILMLAQRPSTAGEGSTARVQLERLTGLSRAELEQFIAAHIPDTPLRHNKTLEETLAAKGWYAKLELGPNAILRESRLPAVRHLRWGCLGGKKPDGKPILPVLKPRTRKFVMAGYDRVPKPPWALFYGDFPPHVQQEHKESEAERYYNVHPLITHPEANKCLEYAPRYAGVADSLICRDRSLYIIAPARESRDWAEHEYYYARVRHEAKPRKGALAACGSAHIVAVQDSAVENSEKLVTLHPCPYKKKTVDVYLRLPRSFKLNSYLDFLSEGVRLNLPMPRFMPDPTVYEDPGAFRVRQPLAVPRGLCGMNEDGHHWLKELSWKAIGGALTLALFNLKNELKNWESARAAREEDKSRRKAREGRGRAGRPPGCHARV